MVFFCTCFFVVCRKFLDLFSHSILCNYPRCRSAQRPENASGFWINHGAFQMHRLEVVVSQVKEFLQNTQKEIIIFDVQEFPYGFNFESVHHLLVKYLQDEFSGYIIPRGANGEREYIQFNFVVQIFILNMRLEWNSKISDLWSAGRIIISYDETSMVSAYPWLWRRVDHKWGDVRTPEALFTYLTG
jgi:hypothetical protein